MSTSNFLIIHSSLKFFFDLNIFSLDKRINCSNYCSVRMVYCSCSESFLIALYRALSHKQLTFLVSGTLEGDKSSESQ